MEKIVLSPPMSNLQIFSPSHSGKTTRILGTYTLKKRRGLWRVLTTLKRVEGGWLNNVGLRNGGIHSIPNKRAIISISSLEDQDWYALVEEIKSKPKVIGVELNISCPNAEVNQLPSDLLGEMNHSFQNVIVKAPHICTLDYLLRLVDMGVKTIHISNTKKTVEGALSGKSLVERNLQTIRDLKVLRPSVKVIGGGGIYDLDSLLRYEDVGADYFSLSTVLFNPLRSRKLIKDYYERSLT
tara:strand:- start:690 stop:1409 length:720 start_codon:yes stop_codon:yes gene_type:complete